MPARLTLQQIGNIVRERIETNKSLEQILMRDGKFDIHDPMYREYLTALGNISDKLKTSNVDKNAIPRRAIDLYKKDWKEAVDNKNYEIDEHSYDDAYKHYDDDLKRRYLRDADDYTDIGQVNSRYPEDFATAMEQVHNEKPNHGLGRFDNWDPQFQESVLRNPAFQRSLEASKKRRVEELKKQRDTEFDSEERMLEHRAEVARQLGPQHYDLADISSEQARLLDAERRARLAEEGMREPPAPPANRPPTVLEKAGAFNPSNGAAMIDADDTNAQIMPISAMDRQLKKAANALLYNAVNQEHLPFPGQILAPRSIQETAADAKFSRHMDKMREEELPHLYDSMGELIDKSHNIDILKNSAADWDRSLAAQDPGYIEDYINKFKSGILDPLREEAEEDYNQNILPRLRNESIRNGSYMSASRASAEANAYQNRMKAYDREAQRSLVALRHQAAEDAHRKSSHFASVAQGKGVQGIAARGEHRLTADALAERVRIKHNLEKDLNQSEVALGREEQAHAQKQNDIDLQRFKEQQEHPFRVAELALNAAHGTNSPQTTLYNAAPIEVERPNVHASAAGILGHVGAGMASGHSHGGYIERYLSKSGTRNYAKGGHVQGLPLPPQAYPYYKDHELPGFQSPEMTRNSELAADFSRGVNPHGNMISNFLLEVADNPKNASYGRAMENHRKDMQYSDQKKIQAANIRNMIQNSRMDTHKLLNEFNKDQRNFSETKRAHDFEMSHKDKQLAETRRLHDSSISMNNAHTKLYEMQATGAGTKPRKFDKSEQDILTNTQRTLDTLPEIEGDLDYLNELSKKIKSGGVMSKVPILKDPLIAGNLPGFSIGEQGDIEAFDKTATDFVIKAAQSFKGRPGIGIAKLIGDSKIHRGMSPDGIEKVYNRMKKAINVKKEEAYFVHDAVEEYGVSPRKAFTAYARYHDAITADPSLKKRISPKDFLGENSDAEHNHSSDEVEDTELADLNAENAALEAQLRGK